MMANKFIKGVVLYLIISLSALSLPPVSTSQQVSVSASEPGVDSNLTTLEYLLNTRDKAVEKPEYLLVQETSGDSEDRNTTSLTVGYVEDEFLIATDEGSNRFYFVGETAGAMISGKGANLMFAYGNTDATGSDGEIRSLAADLSFGGNIHLFRNFLRLPVSIYVPIRLNTGYRNL